MNPGTEHLHLSPVCPLQVSSSSTYTLPPRHGASTTLAAKKAVKVVSRGIQAGE